ncbi:MAG: class I SAM-dependent methyltransferase [Bacteroidales bacterium]
MKGHSISKYIHNLNIHKGFLFEKQVPVIKPFEENYIKAREKEGRIYSEAEIKSLPYLTNHPLANEWKLRQTGTKRVCHYFQKVNEKVLIDIGCGNGWFSHLLAGNAGITVIGLDVNTLELEQASTIFLKDNLNFLFGDIFNLSIPSESIDFVTMNASIQYFPDLDKLFDRLFALLKPGGEIHIIDSPFYAVSDEISAKQRSLTYFTNLGFPAMAKFYYHHTWERLANWEYEALYRPSGMNRLKKLLNKPDSPFPWIRIRKP